MKGRFLKDCKEGEDGDKSDDEDGEIKVTALLREALEALWSTITMVKSWIQNHEQQRGTMLKESFDPKFFQLLYSNLREHEFSLT